MFLRGIEEVPYKAYSDFYQKGQMTVVMNKTQAQNFVINMTKSFPVLKSTKLTFNIYRYIEYILLIGGVVLSFMWQWWGFIPGYFLFCVINRINQSETLANLASAMAQDYDLYLHLQTNAAPLVNISCRDITVNDLEKHIRKIPKKHF